MQVLEETAGTKTAHLNTWLRRSSRYHQFHFSTEVGQECASGCLKCLGRRQAALPRASPGHGTMLAALTLSPSFLSDTGGEVRLGSTRYADRQSQGPGCCILFLLVPPASLWLQWGEGTQIHGCHYGRHPSEHVVKAVSPIKKTKT